MHLVIGGAYQGKKEYVRQQFGMEKEYTGDEIAVLCMQNNKEQFHSELERLPDKIVIGEFHKLIYHLLDAEIDPWDYVNELISIKKDAVIVCNELGCGLVPIDKKDRIYRECVGRILCKIAKDAQTITRVYCGIGEKIK